MAKLPLPNLPAPYTAMPDFMRRLLVKLNEWADKVRRELNNDEGWRDMTSSVSSARLPPASAPTTAAFGPSGLRQELKFAIGDYVWIRPFHVNHDIKVNGSAYLHVHWSTNGTQTNTVKWSMQILRAKGHDQEAFGAPVTVTVEQAAHGVAWQHMIAEVSLADSLTLSEPDELLFVTLQRVTNGGTNNTDNVFGLEVDFHYETDRAATPNKAPNFYL